MEAGQLKVKNKKKSQKRQRQWQIKIPCLEKEFNRVAAEATAAGLSKAAWGRLKMLGDAGERAQRPQPEIDTVLLAKVQGLHGKYGSNLNQIAYELHLRGNTVTEARVEAALEEWAQVRDANLEALGKLPSGRTWLSWKDLVSEGAQYLESHPGEETIRVPADFLRRLIGNGVHKPAA